MKVTKFIPKKITRSVTRRTVVLKHNSPHIFFGLGVVGAVGATVLACRATLKLSDTLEEIKTEVEAVKTHAPEEHQSRDLAYVYGRGTARVVRLYGPAVIVGGLSIAALTGSHVTLSKRNTALTVAYAGLQKAYEDYRARVRDELGEEREFDLHNGIVTGKFKEDGKSVEKKIIDPNKISVYARIFDQLSSNWQPNPEYNLIFLKAQQNYFNDILQSRGIVFLNEVYKSLDLPISQAGQFVGWVLGDEGDNYIDFGLYKLDNARFVNGIEDGILLDFNVDGVVWDKI